jgi:hypothetical protein
MAGTIVRSRSESLKGLRLRTFNLTAELSREPGYRSQYCDWLRAGRRKGRTSSPGRVCQAHPISYPMGTGAKAAGA